MCVVGLNEFLEEDEFVVDNAIANNAFFALNKLVVAAPEFHKEELYARRMHSLITDFISLMPLKASHLCIVAYLLF